jgi:hypothetical protein
LTSRDLLVEFVSTTKVLPFLPKLLVGANELTSPYRTRQYVQEMFLGGLSPSIVRKLILIYEFDDSFVIAEEKVGPSILL